MASMSGQLLAHDHPALPLAYLRKAGVQVQLERAMIGVLAILSLTPRVGLDDVKGAGAKGLHCGLKQGPGYTVAAVGTGDHKAHDRTDAPAVGGRTYRLVMRIRRALRSVAPTGHFVVDAGEVTRRGLRLEPFDETCPVLRAIARRPLLRCDVVALAIARGPDWKIREGRRVEVIERVRDPVGRGAMHFDGTDRVEPRRRRLHAFKRLQIVPQVVVLQLVLGMRLVAMRPKRRKADVGVV